MVADFFPVAIAEVPRILKSCDPNGYASLKTHATSAFCNLIRGFLRQRHDIDLCIESLTKFLLTEPFLCRVAIDVKLIKDTTKAAQAILVDEKRFIAILLSVFRGLIGLEC